ncbi:glutathione hydrolase 1 proenzyme-like [Glandiceps talaboti]
MSGRDSKDDVGEKTALLSSGSGSQYEHSTSSTYSLSPEEKQRINRGVCVLVAVVIAVIAIAVIVIVTLSLLHNVHEEHGAVTSGAKQCSEIGADILRKGGHAVDAAVSTVLCLGVVNAQSSGIGGGGFMLIKNGDTVLTLDFRETAPGAATPDMFQTNETLAEYGGLAVGVPGEVKGLHMAWKRFGRLEWKELFDPVIALARNGFLVTGHTADAVQSKEHTSMAYSPRLKNIYMPNGVPVKEGDILKRPDLANVLETIATEGIDTFYNESLAQNMIDAIQTAGGNMVAEDIAGYEAYWKEPLKSTYHDRTVYAIPLPSGGPVFLSIIGILEGYNLDPSVMDDTLTYHRTIEAFKFGFAQKTRLGDPDFVDDTEELTNIMLNKTWAESLRLRINDNETYPPEYYGPFFPKPDFGTAHACVIDNDDNMVSITSSVNTRFGSAVMTEDGILLNNVMDDFSWSSGNTTVNESTANFIAPGKRPQSSITPILTHRAMSTGEENTIYGGNGGTRILTAVSLVFLNVVSYDLPLEEAGDRLRVHTRLFPNTVNYEIGIPSDVITGLKNKGHEMREEEEATSDVMVAMAKHHTLSAYAERRKRGSGAVVF